MDNLCDCNIWAQPARTCQGEALGLKGEETTQYTPHLPTGAFLVVVYFTEVGRAIQTKSLTSQSMNY